MIDVVSIDPSSPNTTNDLTAVVFGWGVEDGEEELYRYSWFVSDENGTMEQEMNEVTDTFPSARTIKGDLIQVEVTPYNEFGDGPSMLSSVVQIENQLRQSHLFQSFQLFHNQQRIPAAYLVW